MTLTIKPLIVRSLSLFAFGSLMRRDNWFHLLGNHPVIKILSRIASVGNNSVEGQTFNQKYGLTDIRFLSSRQVQTHWIAQPINGDMNLGGEPATTTSQRLCHLAAAFFVPQRRKGVPARWCYQSAHFPYRDHQQNEQTSVPKRPGHTSGQSVCRRCSIFRIRLVKAATVNRCGLSRARLRQNGGIPLRYRCKHAGLISRMTGFLSIGNHLIVQLT